ncbi:hypothetical protein CW304_24260 [Bacillus sp. UFRGS-B20]|nr:hypothetical protein CW304_24260 [Bacillus sp. UFRGS-B20]
MLVKGELNLKGFAMKNNFDFVQEETKENLKSNGCALLNKQLLIRVSVEESSLESLFELIALPKQSSRIREIFQNECI